MEIPGFEAFEFVGQGLFDKTNMYHISSVSRLSRFHFGIEYIFKYTCLGPYIEMMIYDLV